MKIKEGEWRNNEQGMKRECEKKSQLGAFKIWCSHTVSEY
jgi:hypothetical protein